MSLRCCILLSSSPCTFRYLMFLLHPHQHLHYYSLNSFLILLIRNKLSNLSHPLL
uniref:Uncharacterized protein n=1 Tax=Brassica oleracea TaxID=3712 RepID=A0A3P6CSQ3_BRAOL|nr:unnamed protein product [Brassica oleracea]